MRNIRGTRLRRSIVWGLSLAILAMATATGCASGASNPRGEAPREHPVASGGLGFAAFLGTLVYAPAKFVYAIGGSLVGGAAWLFTGGNSEAARNIYEPALRGDYVLTSDHLRQQEPVEFVGRRTSRYPSSTIYSTSELPHVGAGGPSQPPTCNDVPRYASVHFEVDQSTLGATNERMLRRLAATLDECPQRTFWVEGHADAMGEGPYNYVLSVKRALAVRAFLVREGIDPARLRAQGMGETEPRVTNDTPEGRAANRRVEFADP